MSLKTLATTAFVLSALSAGNCVAVIPDIPSTNIAAVTLNNYVGQNGGELTSIPASIAKGGEPLIIGSVVRTESAGGDNHAFV